MHTIPTNIFPIIASYLTDRQGYLPNLSVIKYYAPLFEGKLWKYITWTKKQLYSKFLLKE